MTVKKLRPCPRRNGVVPCRVKALWSADYSFRGMWLAKCSREGEVPYRAVTVPCSVPFHSYTKSALRQDNQDCNLMCSWKAVFGRASKDSIKLDIRLSSNIRLSSISAAFGCDFDYVRLIYQSNSIERFSSIEFDQVWLKRTFDFIRVVTSGDI